MKKFGLIGGTSWHSTIEYYRAINQVVNNHFCDNTNPPLIVYTLNQSQIHKLQRQGDWNTIANILIEAAQSLEKAGAEAAAFCANTPHKVFDTVDQSLELPFIHIADATSDAIKRQGIHKVGLIGTKFSMSEDFLTTRFQQNEIEVLVPDNISDVQELHRIIQEELTFGNILPQSKNYVLKCLDKMIKKGAQGVILGCTEFPLMIHPNDLSIPLFDTTLLHSQTIADYILDKGEKIKN